MPSLTQVRMCLFRRAAIVGQLEKRQNWTDKHELFGRQAKRSLQRGMGLPRRAQAAKLDSFTDVSYVSGGPVEPRHETDPAGTGAPRRLNCVCRV